MVQRNEVQGRKKQGRKRKRISVGRTPDTYPLQTYARRRLALNKIEPAVRRRSYTTRTHVRRKHACHGPDMLRTPRQRHQPPRQLLLADIPMGTTSGLSARPHASALPAGHIARTCLTPRHLCNDALFFVDARNRTVPFRPGGAAGSCVQTAGDGLMV